MRLADQEAVRREYASEERLLARRAVFTDLVSGPNAEDLAFAAVAERRPGSVLEAGSGPGWFSERMARELGADVTALDLSPRMVALGRARGVEAVEGDVQALPFPGARFDVVVANWMLYHVADLDRGLAEIRRVLRPGGRLVAATFGESHLAEVWELLGYEKRAASGFSRETGGALLEKHFAAVECRHADGEVVFPDRDALRRYVAATIRGAHLVDAIPPFAGPFCARSVQAVFVAERGP